MDDKVLNLFPRCSMEERSIAPAKYVYVYNIYKCVYII